MGKFHVEFAYFLLYAYLQPKYDHISASMAILLDEEQKFSKLYFIKQYILL